jgi:hypothetical protein
MVSETTFLALPRRSPLQLCLTASESADEMAMQVLTAEERQVYVDLRLNHLAMLELEHGEQLVETPVDVVAPEGSA